MDIDGFGRETVSSFYTEGLLRSIPDIYKLDFESVGKLEGWKEKSINKLRDGISKSKEQPLWRLVNGLGVRHIVTQTAKDLVKTLNNLKELFGVTPEQLQSIDGIGPKVASSVLDYFHNAGNQHMILELEDNGLNLKNQKVEAQSAKLNSLTFYLPVPSPVLPAMRLKNWWKAMVASLLAVSPKTSITWLQAKMPAQNWTKPKKLLR